MSKLRDETVMSYLERHNIDVTSASKYGEPGYSDPERCILFGNWNNVSKGVCAVLERAGYELEWYDEWTTDECGEYAYRSSPDSHGWTPSFTWTEDSIICAHEKNDCAEQLIEWWLNNPRSCMTRTMSIDLAAHGFTVIEADKETGFHPGQTDDAHKTLSRLQEMHPDKEFIFDTTDVGQFDIRWQVWARDA